jgi:hypothetical protein
LSDLSGKAFHEEQEWRIVIRPRELLKQGTDDGGKTSPQICFRSSRGIVIPYLHLLLIQDKPSIRRIKFGATLDPERKKASIEILLDASGFRHFGIEGTDIPLVSV